MFGEQNDLSNVLGVVCHLSADRLEHRIGLTTNRDLLLDVFCRERLKGRENKLPALVLPLPHLPWRGRGIENELAVPIATWLLAIAIEEIRPS